MACHARSRLTACSRMQQHHSASLSPLSKKKRETARVAKRSIENSSFFLFLVCGTTGLTAYPDVDADDDPVVAEKVAALQEQEPVPSILRPLTTHDETEKEEEDEEDAEGSMRSASWSVRKGGDTSSLENGAGNTTTPHGIAVLRSTKWPGATTVADGSSFVNHYVGFGICAGTVPFFPAAPGEVQAEPDDLEEQPEPQPDDDEMSDGGSQGEDEEGEDDEGDEDAD